MGDSHADIQKHVRTYLIIFAALAVLTIVTVGVSYLHLSFVAGVILAMIIASVKGGLVAAYFMHLIDEKKVIYWILGLTVFFFVVLMSVPALWEANSPSVHGLQPGPSVEAAPGADHGEDAGDH